MREGKTLGRRGVLEKIGGRGVNLIGEAGDVRRERIEGVLVVVGGEEGPSDRHQSLRGYHFWRPNLATSQVYE